jgi:hypothetical protein
MVPFFCLLLAACGGGGGGGDGGSGGDNNSDIRYTVSAVAGSGGSISPPGATAIAGETASFTLSPDSDHEIAGAAGCGGTLAGSSYTTGPITADCSVSASFIPTASAWFTVSTSAGAGGNLSPASIKVVEGETTGISVIPDTGFEISTVTGCGGTLTGATYTTGPVTADCTVNASFTPLTGASFTVNAVAGTGGGIVPDSVTAAAGETVGFTLAPDSGYEIAGAAGCGGTLTGVTYTTAPVSAACTVSASFIPIDATSYNVSARVAGTGGSVSPTSIKVVEGESAGFTLTPDSGFEIENASGCGGTLSGSSYLTGPVTADCEVVVGFIAMTSSVFTVSTNAGTGGDITPATLSVADGETASFTLTPDSGHEIESASGCGGTLTGATYTTGPVTADCTVSAGFVALPIVSFTGNPSVLEGEGTANLVFPLSLSAQANGDVSVDYATTDGSAVAGSDYTAASGTLIFATGTNSNRVIVPVLGDTLVEGHETLMLTLSNVSSNAVLGNATAIGTLLNDEATGTLNDTGITICGDYAYGAGSALHQNDLDCAASRSTADIPGTDGDGDPVPAGQDAHIGRDATDNDDADGHAGFSFVKISGTGSVLDASASRWDCVLDRVTGLMWEVKTDDGGLRDVHWTYSWYNSAHFSGYGKSNGGACFDAVNCDSEKYAAQVNANGGICGFSDWRMPTRLELISLLDSGVSDPALGIDATYFPNTTLLNGLTHGLYWSASASSGVDAYYVDPRYLEVETMPKTSPISVRLVRSGS